MKTYVVQVELVLIKASHLPSKCITIKVNGKEVVIDEAPDVKFRCSRLKFIDNGREVTLQSDGLKIIFSLDGETLSNVSLFRSHVAHVCGITTEQIQKKRPASSTAFDSIRSPAAERRQQVQPMSSTRSSAGHSPGMDNKYQRQIVSSVKKSLLDSAVSSMSSDARPTHSTSHKKLNSLFGSPVPVSAKRHTNNNSSSSTNNGISNRKSNNTNNRDSSSSDDNYNDIISSANMDRYDPARRHSQASPSQAQSQSDARAAGKKPRTSTSPVRKVSCVFP